MKPEKSTTRSLTYDYEKNYVSKYFIERTMKNEATMKQLNKT